MVRDIYQAAVEIPEPYSSLSADERRQARQLLARFEKLEATHSVLPNGEIVRPMLLSKNGRHEEALAVTEQNYQQAPDWKTAVAVATGRPGHYYAVQAYYITGDPKWTKYFRLIKGILLEQQRRDGSWPCRTGPGDAFGTAVATLILQIPLQYLPIFQR